MRSLLIRNLFFTIIHPGVVAGVIPAILLGSRLKLPVALLPHHYLGITGFLAGFIITADCIIRFARTGKGTLSPADPTKKLVVKGLYKYSRNPMYVGVMLMLISEAAFFESATLWMYAGVVFLAFNLFIRFVEEPRLLRDFGEEYESYRNRVGRWVGWW